MRGRRVYCFKLFRDMVDDYNIKVFAIAIDGSRAANLLMITQFRIKF